MFTGIIEATATVLKRTDHQLVIERPRIFDDIAIGSSICVAGVCLSVVQMNDTMMTFDVVEETWKKTKLATLREGDLVNLERAVRLGSRLNGHIVQGHVEGTAKITSFSRSAGEGQGEGTLTFELPPDLVRNVLPKASIAIDGVSLTIADIEQNLCTIALIPLTLTSTTLSTLHEGDLVNVETDIMLKRT